MKDAFGVESDQVSKEAPASNLKLLKIIKSKKEVTKGFSWDKKGAKREAKDAGSLGTAVGAGLGMTTAGNKPKYKLSSLKNNFPAKDFMKKPKVGSGVKLTRLYPTTKSTALGAATIGGIGVASGALAGGVKRKKDK